MSEMNIYQRLNKVREAVDYIQKDASVQGYKAVTHDQVTSEVRPHFIEHGIMVVPNVVESHETEVVVNGKSWVRYAARYVVDFVNIDKPDDRVSVTTEAHALDNSDKAPGKATSYATKYAMLKLLSIETGENEESRQEMKPKPLSDEQVKNIQALIKEAGADVKKFLKHYGIEKVEQLPAQKYDNAVGALEAKLNDNA